MEQPTKRERGRREQFPQGVNAMFKRALVVDNDFFFVEFLAELLEKRGCQVVKAYDGKEAISKLEQQSVDILFVDMIMPKIDGRQLIGFVRSRFPDSRFPIVAFSGTIIEQLDRLEELGADYFVAKGPVEEMTRQIEMLMDKMEEEPIPSSSPETILGSDNLMPRQEIDELLQTVNFYSSINQSIGVGLIILARDARIILTNPMALEIVNKLDHEILNQQITDLFEDKEKPRLVKALKNLLQKPEVRRISFFATIDSKRIRMIVSLLSIDNEIAGWVLAMEEAGNA